MNPLRIADDCFLPVPAGFHVLSEEERRAMRVPAEGPWVGMSDPERHILVTGGVRPLGRIRSILLSERDCAAHTETWIRRALKPFGYRGEKLTRREIAGARAWCFRCTYEAEGIPMCAESCTIKRGGDLVWLHLYAREERREESFAVWETILSSAGRRADTSA